MKVSLIVFLFLLASCGVFQSKENPETRIRESLKKYSLHQEADFINHLAALGQDYINSPGVAYVKLNDKSKAYLTSLYYRIVGNNELLFKKEIKPRFYIIKQKTPFYFSLPHGQFFFSSGILRKYLRHEELLASALTSEILKTHNNLYQKKVIVPVGHLVTARILSLTRTSLKIRSEINKWTFYALKRAGFDAYVYLNWLQTLNKNTLDFALQFGGVYDISREEFLFKNFIVKEGLDSDFEINTAHNSSAGFYQLMNFVKRVR